MACEFNSTTLKRGPLGMLHYFGLIGYNVVNVRGGMSSHLYFFFFLHSFVTVDSHLCIYNETWYRFLTLVPALS